MTTTAVTATTQSTTTRTPEPIKMYLRAVKATKRTGPGRPREKSAIQGRLDRAEASLVTAKANGNVIAELKATQRLLDAQADMRAFVRGEAMNPTNFEDAFVKAAPKFTKSTGISRAAWLKVGVPAEVLAKAGI